LCIDVETLAEVFTHCGVGDPVSFNRLNVHLELGKAGLNPGSLLSWCIVLSECLVECPQGIVTADSSIEGVGDFHTSGSESIRQNAFVDVVGKVAETRILIVAMMDQF
jgi:hypothetical protein